eukprot:1179819-Prorocentrum_minimum.AAC.5
MGISPLGWEIRQLGWEIHHSEGEIDRSEGKSTARRGNRPFGGGTGNQPLRGDIDRSDRGQEIHRSDGKWTARTVKGAATAHHLEHVREEGGGLFAPLRCGGGAAQPPHRRRARRSPLVDADETRQWKQPTCRGSAHVGGACNPNRTRGRGLGVISEVTTLSITSFYGSSCANNGKDAHNTPETLRKEGVRTQSGSPSHARKGYIHPLFFRIRKNWGEN